MNHETQPRVMTAMCIAIFACIVVIMGFGLGKLTGALDPLVARRGVGVFLGLALVANGNFVPKLRLFESTGAANSDAVDRFAGWTFVLCGIAFAVVFLLAPANLLFIVPPSIALAGFLAVLVRWLMLKGKQPIRLWSRLTNGRLMLAIMLVSLFWTSALFLVDVAWGDAASRWMAIVFAFAIVLVPTLLAFRRLRSIGT